MLDKKSHTKKTSQAWSTKGKNDFDTIPEFPAGAKICLGHVSALTVPKARLF